MNATAARNLFCTELEKVLFDHAEVLKNVDLCEGENAWDMRKISFHPIKGVAVSVIAALNHAPKPGGYLVVDVSYQGIDAYATMWCPDVNLLDWWLMLTCVVGRCRDNYERITRIALQEGSSRVSRNAMCDTLIFLQAACDERLAIASNQHREEEK